MEDNQDNYDSVWAFFEQDFEKGRQYKELSDKRKEWGKLGGRPIKEIKRTKSKTFRFTEKEFCVLEEKAKLYGVSVSEYVRMTALGYPIPDSERNKILVRYALNFVRIGNFFKKPFWTENEKKEMLEEIKEVSSLIKKNLQNGR